jgi:hypothetical protein
VRVSLTVVTFFSFLVVACSSAEQGKLLKHRSGASASPDEPAASATPRPPPPPGKPSSDDPVPANDSPPPPAPPPADAGPGPAPGTCVNPTCDVSQNGARCVATDESGQSVEMDCQGGVCSCWTGDVDTTDFLGDPQDVGDAKALYFSNCGCI